MLLFQNNRELGFAQEVNIPSDLLAAYCYHHILSSKYHHQIQSPMGVSKQGAATLIMRAHMGILQELNPWLINMQWDIEELKLPYS